MIFLAVILYLIIGYITVRIAIWNQEIVKHTVDYESDVAAHFYLWPIIYLLYLIMVPHKFLLWTLDRNTNNE